MLLRDAARTLMKATLCIRRAGLKQHMPQEPGEFLSAMNKQCMTMSAQRRQKDSKRQRKRILRVMKRLANRSETELSIGQARVIEQRIQRVLEQLPAAIKQAHERIIGGRSVKNTDKILSLYDDEIERQRKSPVLGHVPNSTHVFRDELAMARPPGGSWRLRTQLLRPKDGAETSTSRNAAATNAERHLKFSADHLALTCS